MGANTKIKAVLCALIAAVLTGGIYHLDRDAKRTHEREFALRWARQIASQVEGLAYNARLRGEADPLGTAAAQISLGNESRIVKVTKIQSALSTSQTESHNWDSFQNVFEYRKIVTPEDGKGLRVQIQQPYTGFVGTRTHLTNDLITVIVFLAIFAFLFFIPIGSDGKKSGLLIKQLLSQWSQQAKALMSQAGAQLKEMVKEATQLATSARTGHEALNALHESTVDQVQSLGECRQWLAEADEAAAQAEAVALSTVIEANRMGEEGKHLAQIAQGLHGHLQRVRALKTRCDCNLAQVEIFLQKLESNTHGAIVAHDEVIKTAHAMNSHIRKTTEILIGQAKLIQDLQAKTNDAKSA